MTDKTISLRQLLELASGRLPEPAQTNLQSQCMSRPLWHDRWSRLKSLVNQNSAQGNWTNPTLAPERVAAYLDHRLTDSQGAAFEERCWADNDLLSEVVCLYLEQSLALNPSPEPPVEVPISLALSRRLMALPRQVPSRPQRPLTTLDTLANTDRPESKPMVGPSAAKRPQNLGNSRTFAISIVCLVVICLFATSSGLWHYYRPNERRDAAEIPHVDGLPSEPSATIVDSSIPERVELTQTPVPQRDPIDHPADRINNQGANAEPVGDNVPLKDPPRIAETPRPVRPFDPNRRPPPRQNDLISRAEISIPLSWESLVGLYAWRSPEENSTWQGPKSLSLETRSPLIQVLPQGLASCSLPESGQVYARGDSLFSLTATKQDQDLASHVQLHRGALAFVDLPADFALSLQWDDSQVSIVSLSDSAAWEVEWVNETPCLFVSEGEVDVEGIRVRAAQNYDLQMVGTGAAQPTIEKRGEWWKNETPMTTWSRTSRERLADSRDLPQDLLTFANEGTRQQQILANHWLVSLAPEKHLLVALEHRDLRVREQATSWLLNSPSAERQMQRYWRQLLVDQVRPAQLRALMNLSRANRSRTPVPLVELEPVVESLHHRRLAIRQVAATLLEQRFGNPANYRADATDAIRQSSALSWAEWIRKSMVRTRQ